MHRKPGRPATAWQHLATGRQGARWIGYRNCPLAPDGNCRSPGRRNRMICVPPPKPSLRSSIAPPNGEHRQVHVRARLPRGRLGADRPCRRSTSNWARRRGTGRTPQIREVLAKYYSTAVPAEQRLRILNLISNLTARNYGGYQSVLATPVDTRGRSKRRCSRSSGPTEPQPRRTTPVISRGPSSCRADA
jgi:hypothetical protein